MEAPIDRPPLGHHYALVCPVCGGRFPDSTEGFLLSCPGQHAPALLRAVYDEQRLTVHAERRGAYRYAAWLPVRRALPNGSLPVVFPSTGVGPALGLENLFIAFSGFWPEKGAAMETCTFKELEAQAVCGRIGPDFQGTLVVASAGNTARAFHAACARCDVPATLVVPQAALSLLWERRPMHSRVRVVAISGDADYADAIELGNALAALPGSYSEGGARNVARRDGMGAVLLAAVEVTGRIPDHYVQAVGSGTGAIAAWEAMLRLAADGRYGGPVMRLHLSQNAPFTPMTDAWEAGTRSLPDQINGRARARAVLAPVLTNRAPPYTIAGGLYDALSATDGFMYRVTNDEARAAGLQFERTEGIDIDPAAQVALASLREAVARGRIGRADMVVLNVTGGGAERLRSDGPLAAIPADIVVPIEELSGPGRDRALGRIREVCS